MFICQFTDGRTVSRLFKILHSSNDVLNVKCALNDFYHMLCKKKTQQSAGNDTKWITVNNRISKHTIMLKCNLFYFLPPLEAVSFEGLGCGKAGKAENGKQGMSIELPDGFSQD